MKATFFERLGAFLIDMLVVNFIFSIICLGLGNNVSNTEKEMQELDELLMKEEITVDEYYEEYSSLLYDYQKENILQSGISVALTIAYYVVFQYMNKGQTIGKKLLKIQVLDKDTEKPICLCQRTEYRGFPLSPAQNRIPVFYGGQRRLLYRHGRFCPGRRCAGTGPPGPRAGPLCHRQLLQYPRRRGLPPQT